MMPQKFGFSLKAIQEELQLKALIHFDKQKGVVEEIGDEIFVNALVNSNLLEVLKIEMAMPIRLANNEIYEIVLQNNRGLVAKEGRINRYLIALNININNVLAAIGDNIDPGMVLFDLMQNIQRK
ncbi:MAG: hypothetical protein JSV04_09365 [Candidatus Heimdallarchaeota archaeon]|nr:MAG: hypothetical protein JSV04_09365 [Candidatus Heimdallarchaeota archaeon]